MKMNAADPALDESARPEGPAGPKSPDTSPDEVLTGLARIAATVVDCPIAQISLIGADGQWVRAGVGLDLEQTPRDTSLFAAAILSDRLFEVTDAPVDHRFADSPFVTGEPHVRFYVGVPLEINGLVIGALCVMDRAPRQLDDAQRKALVELGHAVVQLVKSWRQQDESREAAAYRHLVFDRLGDGVMLLDMEYRILDTNPIVTALLGYEHDELLQLRGYDVVAEFERHRFSASRSADDAEARRMGEWELIHKDGHPVPVEVNVRRLDDTRYIAVMRDIAQRRSRDQLLRELSQAVEQSVESVVIANLDRTIEYVNTAATTLLGYDRSELIGQATQFLRSGDTPKETYDEVYKNIAAGRSWQGVLSNRRKDGTVYLQSTVISPIRGHHGRITHTLASMEDVTEKIRMSEELDRYRHHLEELVEVRTAELAVAKRAAEAANKVKSDFLLTMSHEIRTPMNGVIGSVDVLRQSSLTPNQRDLSDTIHESACALLDVIDDMLDFSKIEAGRLTLESESICLSHLVEGVCDSLRPLATGRNVGLQVFVDPSLPDHVLTDPTRLRQILNNLVGNAIKFSAGQENGGRVRVSVQPGGAQWMCLKVTDNGIGMTHEVLSKIFQPFVQADSSTARHFGGTGLGLSICHQLTTLFSGSIDVTSRPGAGTCFTVRLPLHDDRSRAATATQSLLQVDCHLVLDDGLRSEDWCSYLRSAGACATMWASVDAMQREFVVQLERTAVLLVDEGSYRGLADWISTADDGGPIPTVCVRRGQRRNARLEGPGEVSVDGDALHRESLLTAVALAVGRAEPEIDEPTCAFPPAPVSTRDEAVEQGRLILVAEDNEINQKVIKRQLALLGFAADVVPDGIAAREAWRAGRYGLLLTDVRMPGIDGYELARTIRLAEGHHQHVPIVALTANALPGEADRCRLAGMDAHLNKPVQLDELAAVLTRWLPVCSVNLAGREATGAILPVLDRTALRRLMGDDAAAISDLQRAFLCSARAAAEEVRAAVLTGDSDQVASIARRLKSSADTVGAIALGECCKNLERARNANDGAANLDAVTAFEAAIVCVIATLSSDSQGMKPTRPPAPSSTTKPGRAKVYTPDELRRGIEDGQLLLHFQPKISLSAGIMVGVKALVRWKHPLDGLLHPVSFVPVAEAHGLMEPLTQTVIATALEQTLRWRKAGLKLRVAVNITTGDLKRVGFVESLLSEIHRHGLRPADAILEIADSRLWKDRWVPMEALTRLRLEGVGLSIDDFGIGHASVSRLRDFPFDELKINLQSAHGRDLPIERASLCAGFELARQLGMTTVAAGVEDQADWDLVTASGCGTAQGYFIAPPMPASHLVNWAAGWRRSSATL